jgi:hypothetical protein
VVAAVVVLAVVVLVAVAVGSDGDSKRRNRITKKEEAIKRKRVGSADPFY